MRTSIKVIWQFVGFHSYKDAPEQVEFLKLKHRHLFKCSAKIEVFHDDRELEFFMVQEDLKNMFGDNQLNNASCEMIAKLVMSYLANKYGHNRKYEIEVSEDGENSAVVES